VAAKVANVGVPLVLKEIVDGLDSRKAVLVLPLALLVMPTACCACRPRCSPNCATWCSCAVTQRAIRRIALRCSATSMRCQPALSPRPPDRRHVARHRARHPRHLDAAVVHAVLDHSGDPRVHAGGGGAAAKFDWRFPAVTFTAVASTSASRSGHRVAHGIRAGQRARFAANTRAIDSLLNYETVKYFNNEEYEARATTRICASYETMAVKNEASLGLLNVGQA
jgi:ATP-binding cassette, subfamily B, heavy metal transporter